MQISYYSSKFPPDLAIIDSCLTYSSSLQLQNDFPSPVSCLVWQSALGFLLWARAPSLSFTYTFVIGVDSHIPSSPVASNSVLYIPVLVLSGFLRFDSAAAAAKSLQSCPTLRPHRRQPTSPHRPWDSPGKNTRVRTPLIWFMCSCDMLLSFPSPSRPPSPYLFFFFPLNFMAFLIRCSKS